MTAPGSSNRTTRPGTRGELQRNLALLACATLIAFLLGELGARMLLPTPPFPDREPQIEYVFDADVGYLHVPNQRGWIDDGQVTINSLGFRGREPLLPKPPGRFRIIALGDSCTVGWGVDDEETYCVRLENLLRDRFPKRDFDVINLGVSGHDLAKAARILSNFAPLLEPDLVLIGVTWNDLPYEKSTPDGNEVQAPALLGPIAPGDRFRLVGRHSRLNLLLRRSRFIYALGRLQLQLKYALGWRDHQLLWEQALLNGQQSVAIAAAWNELASSLETLKAVADSHELDAVILAMPFRNQLRGAYPGARYQSQLYIIGQRLTLPVVDPLPQFQRQGTAVEELFIPFDRIHLGPRGYLILAETVLQFLLSDGSLSQPHPSHRRPTPPT